MPRSGGVLAFTAGLVFSGAAVIAHHSIASVYDSAKQATIDGVVVQFHFVNPHPWLTVEVTDGSGAYAVVEARDGQPFRAGRYRCDR